MSTTLLDHNYGASRVRLIKVHRQQDRHDLKELSVSIQLEGEFESSYTSGDNRSILPADTIGQTWFPYFVSLLRRNFGDYEHALMSVFAMAIVGAAAIAMLPKYGRQDETLHVQEPERSAAGR